MMTTSRNNNWLEDACCFKECVCLCPKRVSAAGDTDPGLNPDLFYTTSHLSKDLSPQHRLSSAGLDHRWDVPQHISYEPMTLPWHQSQFRFIVLYVVSLRGIVYPKMKIPSSFMYVLLQNAEGNVCSLVWFCFNTLCKFVQLFLTCISKIKDIFLIDPFLVRFFENIPFFLMFAEHKKIFFLTSFLVCDLG